MDLAPYENPAARRWRAAAAPSARAFHRSLPGYAPTRLVELPGLAAELGVARVVVKEESARFGLPAFKILGAAYAIARALSARAGVPDRALTLDELRERVAAQPLELVAATDGNHGRAVAHAAAWLGLPARIFHPRDITDAAKAAIASEGAVAIELDAPYDDVVQAAIAAAGDATLLVQDTSWEGYSEIPAWIVDGYRTLFEEADEQLDGVAPTVVAVPVGVGSLAQAAVAHHRATGHEPRIVSVEPVNAPAILASLHAGEQVSVPTSATIMAGLNCGTPSEEAWPVLSAGLDTAVAIEDAAAARAVRDLEAFGVDSGPCGAATLAGVRTLDLAADDVVLLISSEGRAANPIEAS